MAAIDQTKMTLLNSMDEANKTIRCLQDQVERLEALVKQAKALLAELESE